MTQKRKNPKEQRAPVEAKPAPRSPKEVFEFWDQDSMRQAVPLPLDLPSPPRDADDPQEE